jgi:hypothetical protein
MYKCVCENNVVALGGGAHFMQLDLSRVGFPSNTRVVKSLLCCYWCIVGRVGCHHDDDDDEEGDDSFETINFFSKRLDQGGWLIASSWIDCLLLLSYLVSSFDGEFNVYMSSYKCLFFLALEAKKDDWEASFPPILVTLYDMISVKTANLLRFHNYQHFWVT